MTMARVTPSILIRRSHTCRRSTIDDTRCRGMIGRPCASSSMRMYSGNQRELRCDSQAGTGPRSWPGVPKTARVQDTKMIPSSSKNTVATTPGSASEARAADMQRPSAAAGLPRSGMKPEPPAHVRPRRRPANRRRARAQGHPSWMAAPKKRLERAHSTRGPPAAGLKAAGRVAEPKMIGGATTVRMCRSTSCRAVADMRQSDAKEDNPPPRSWSSESCRAAPHRTTTARPTSLDTSEEEPRARSARKAADISARLHAAREEAACRRR